MLEMIHKYQILKEKIEKLRLSPFNINDENDNNYLNVLY